MNQSNFNLENVSLETLLFEIIEGVNGSYMRPYSMVVNENTVNTIGEFNERGLLGQLTPSVIGQSMADSLTIGGPTVMSAIPNGWSSIRARFVLKVRMSYSGVAGDSIVTLSGFTDYFEESFNHTVDPAVSLIVNSYHTTKESGMSNGVVALSTMQPFDDRLNGQLYDMSPNVAVGAIATNALISQHQYAGLDVADTSTMLKARPTQTDRSYLNPSVYIAKLINDCSKVSSGAEEVSSMGESFSTDENANLSYSMFSGDYRANPFIAYMGEYHGGAPTTRSFSLGDLMALDPTLDNRFNVVDTRLSSPTYAHESQDLASASLESHIAHTVSSVIPSILSATGASTVTFVASNITVEGMPVVDVQAITMVSGIVSNSVHRDYVANRIISEIMVPLSVNGMYMFQITCNLDLTADANITVQLDQGVPTPFAIPVFADSIFNPVLTHDVDESNSLSMNVSSLLNYVAAPNIETY